MPRRELRIVVCSTGVCDLWAFQILKLESSGSFRVAWSYAYRGMADHGACLKLQLYQ